MSDNNDQKITALSPADGAQLTRQRSHIESFLATDDSRRSYKEPQGKLGTIQAILDADLFSPDQAYELECLGVVLADAFVQGLGMEWIIVEDEIGRNASIRVPNSSIILFPLTMIRKRIIQGERVDVFNLFNNAARNVHELRLRGV